MSYFDDPLIPILQQAPSAMFRLGLIDPLTLPQTYAYWNAQVDASLFTDVAGTTEVGIDGDDVKNWRELTGTQPPGTAPGATNFPAFDLTNGIRSVEFSDDRFEVIATDDQFIFMEIGSTLMETHAFLPSLRLPTEDLEAALGPQTARLSRLL